MRVQDRVETLRAKLGAAGLDGLLVSNPENRRYLSDFTGRDDRADSAGVLVVGAREAVLITDGRYTEQAASECPGLPVITRVGPLAPVAAELADELALRRLGYEATHLTVAQRDDLAAASEGLALELVPTRSLVESQRVVKDADEIAAIERAVAITDATFEHLLGYMRLGMTERQVAFEIQRFMHDHGSDGMAFAPIVASGPNAALPHAVPSDRQLGRGETLVVDMGARYDGYCADMTRTICFGRAPKEMRAVYDAVLRANVACEEGLRAGITGQAADALARDVLEAAGRGAQFVHGTGHGLGLEIHEDPRLSKVMGEQTLAPNMVVTVEPGAYIAGWGGVRIEDTVVVTVDGTRALTKSPKALVVPVRRGRRTRPVPAVV
jgi:Xaa-Pro aminopeptidase